ncbi:DUF3226 domain-containing protein [Pseudophaeobacter sp.]|uniref:DUF3226 domain-containing protein n=1 Tax=Pseudophaeobacter sp. TaxID=1971739 RepID=UPI00326E0698
MRNFVFVTEGNHDVSFIGKLLTRRGFLRVTEFESLPEGWDSLYPRKFPWNGDSIERVARFPDVYANEQIAVGLINSGGDSRLVSSLRNALDVMIPENVELAIIFSDADAAPARSRFEGIQNELKELNFDAVGEEAPGYPVTVPSEIAAIEGSKPAMGIFVFPDNSSCGSLEDILFSCSQVSHPDLADRAKSFVEEIDETLEEGHKSLKKMRAGLGRKKSIMGTIANVLKPGSSLAVAVEQQKLIPDNANAPELVKRLDSFLDDCL